MSPVGREEFEKKLWSAMPGLTFREFQLIMLAYRLSKYGHRNQKRDGGGRYFEHPKRVALILMDECGIVSPDTTIVSLLHDIKEDSFILTWDDIEIIFGKKIRKMIETLTKNKKLSKSLRDEEYSHKLLIAPREVKTVKLADRLDNIRDMKGWPLEKIKEYIEETARVFLPMAKETNEYLYREINKICERYQ